MITVDPPENEISSRVYALQHSPGPDIAAAERAVKDLLSALGKDVTSPHLIDTPKRVAQAYLEFLSAPPPKLTTFPNDESYDELILVRDIPFSSLCEHHLLPFYGVAHVAYIPADRIVGLSKLARVVNLFARDFQVQERLTSQVADCIQNALDPKGIGVVLQADHLCMSLRGVHSSGARAVTSAVRGRIRTDGRSRKEFFDLVGP